MMTLPPLAGVSFELTRLGRKSTDSDSVKRINSFDRILKTFNNEFTGETIALKSNLDGKLTVIDNENNGQESTSPISLEYDTQYKLVKKFDWIISKFWRNLPMDNHNTKYG